jgi:hypothetical protein
MARPPTRLSDDQLRDLLRLAKASDSVELKLTVPASGQRSALRALGVDPLDAQIRQVFFFDTPDLTLYQAGLNLRARRMQGKGEDSVVKLRPVDPDQLDAEWRVSPNMKVEVDAMPGGYICSASVKGKPGDGDTRSVALGGLPVRKLFSKEQRTFYAMHAPEGLEMDELVVLGPIFVLRRRSRPRASSGAWSARCGSTPTAGGSSSSRRSVRRGKRCRSRPKPGCSSPTTTST